MIEIPLSSVIVHDQEPIENSSQSDDNYPRLTGLGPLRTANKLFIKQRIRAGDILSLLTGCEVIFDLKRT